MSGESVLVTGGSGFLGVHCILRLLGAGYRVRTTVRSPGREADVRAMLEVGGASSGDALEFFAADLTADKGWAEAASGCSYVLHVASPFPGKLPKHEDELIVPAREGALRVLRAALKAGVRRVVMTSSFAAVGYSAPPAGRPYSEMDWTDPNEPGISAYVKSKTLAEKAAWEFTQSEGRSLELAVINPTGILGPVLGPDYSTSIQLVERLLDGTVPGSPRMSMGLVDVRDVADLHLRAMTNPAAKGERFLATNGDSVSMHDVAKILKATMGANARKVPMRVLPDWLVKVVALFDPSVRLILSELGKTKRISNEKARSVLGWKPRTNEEAILATAQSLLRLGLLKNVKAQTT